MNRLYRSRRDRVLLGVCGGIAHYLRVDPVIVRVIWVLVSLTPFPGIIAYLVAALLMPEEPQPAAAAPKGAPGPEKETAAPPGGEETGVGGPAGETTAPEQRERTVRLLGWGLVAVGAVLLAYNWAVMAGLGRLLRMYLPFFDWRFWMGLSTSWWPLVLIVLGAVILWRGVRKCG
ncbi:MAG: PspC domain-containing protein [Bacillota bacterium]